jgi:hypothetical protein
MNPGPPGLKEKNLFELAETLKLLSGKTHAKLQYLKS